MFELLAVAVGFNQLGIPFVGFLALLASKLSHGRNAELADRFLLSMLALMTVMTFHGLLVESPYWMMHGMTLGIMTLGAVWEPGKTEVSCG